MSYTNTYKYTSSSRGGERNVQEEEHRQVPNGSSYPPTSGVGEKQATKGALHHAVSNVGASGQKGFTGTQEYDALLQRLKGSGKLFEDLEFPAVKQSINIDEQQTDSEGNVTFDPNRIVWKRPGELTRTPKFMVEGASRFDVVQGSVLGDCWLLASIACVSMYKDLLFQVVDPEQEFDKNYCGLFHFRFFHFGKWVDVCIDDRLPTFDGELVFVKSSSQNEFWSALLEKAYAKLTGNYGALEAGSAGDALQDLTGGMVEKNEMSRMSQEELRDLFDTMSKYQSRASLMSASLSGEDEVSLTNGLVSGHSYSVTGVRKFKTNKGEIKLVRLRNPWGGGGGQQTEWNGAWCDNAPEWKQISAEEKAAAQLGFDDDGEFWMSFEDFVTNYTTLDICHLTANTLGNDSHWSKGESAQSSIRKMLLKQKTNWNFDLQYSSWVKNASAGGPYAIADPQTKKVIRNPKFHMNPQFQVEIGSDTNEKEAMLVVGVMQKDDRMKRLETGAEIPAIGYFIFDGNNTNGLVGKDFFEKQKNINKFSFVDQREVSGRHRLPPGRYIIVPTTSEPNVEAEFLIRIFSEKKNAIKESDQESKVVEVDTSSSDNEVTRIGPFLKQLWPYFASNNGEASAFGLQNYLTAAFSGQLPKHIGSKLKPDQLQQATIAAQKLFALWTASGSKKFKVPSIDICRSFVAIFDVNGDGKMDLDEQISFLKFSFHWEKVFTENDKDNSGALSWYEMRDALAAVGFTLSNKNFGSVMHRYADEEGNIDMEHFLLCSARLRLAFGICSKLPSSGTKGAEVLQIESDLLMKTLIDS